MLSTLYKHGARTSEVGARALFIYTTLLFTLRTDRSFSLSSWYTPANLSLARRRGWRVHLATLRHLGFTHHCDPAPLCHPSLSIITLQYPPLALLSIVKKRSVSCVSVYTLSHTHIFRFSLHGEHGRGAGARFPEERNNDELRGGEGSQTLCVQNTRGRALGLTAWARPKPEEKKVNARDHPE